MRRTRMHRNKRKTRKQCKQRRSVKSIQRGGVIPVEDYTTILGSGGFGMILGEPTQTRVVKLYYNKLACRDMQNEYRILQKVYDAFEEYPIPQVLVPKPIQIDNTPFRFQERDILCGIEMSRLQPLEIMRDKANPIVHVLLAYGMDESTINKEMAKDASEPISDKNPSRGFFAGPTYIETIILPSLTPEEKGNLTSIQAITETIGKTFGIMIGVAGIIPIDVEYCLVMNNGQLHIAVLDFGMAYEFPPDLDKSAITQQILKGNGGAVGAEIDIYFPARREPLFEFFENGMNEVLRYIEKANAHKKNILAHVIETYGI